MTANFTNSGAKLRWALPLIYAVSGFCSLVYELVWMRQLGLVFGSSFTAVSVVTAVFFTGLALGGWAGGRLARDARRPLKVYGLLEAGITLSALLVPLALTQAEYVYAAWYPVASSSLQQTALIRLFLSACLLLVPTTLMGATVPLIVRCYSTREGLSGGDTGLIYGLNSLGAALGVLAAGFLLFRYLGLGATNTLAVTCNALIAVAACWLSRREAVSDIKMQTASPVVSELKMQTAFPVVKAGQVGSGTILACFALSGFLYVGYELLWMRTFLLVFRDSIYLYASCLAAVIVGVAFGSAVSGHIADRICARRDYLGWLFCAASLLHTALLLGLVRLHRPLSLLGFTSPALEAGFIFGILIIPFALGGGTFPVVTRLLAPHAKNSGWSASKAYTLNTLGSIGGALITPFFLFPALGLDRVMWLFLGLGLGSAVLMWLGAKHGARSLLLRCALVCGVLPAFLFTFSAQQQGVFMGILNQLKGSSEILEANQSPLGSNWVLESPDEKHQVVLYENLVAFSRGGSPSFVVQGFLPLILAEKTPTSVLGLCFGGGLTYSATQYFPEIKSIDLVDISAGNVNMALQHLSINEALKKDKRVRFFIDDAYSYVKYAKNSYDLILIDSNPPFYSHNCSTLYSHEFYKLCSNLLSENGMFTQVLPIKQMTLPEVQSVLRTFATVFPHTLLWWNELDPLMLGSQNPIILDTEGMNSRLNRPGVGEALRSSSGDAKLDTLGHFLSGLMMNNNSFKTLTDGGPINSTDKNYLEYSRNPNVDQSIMPWLTTKLAPWNEIQQSFRQPEIAEAYAEPLERRRAYLMGLAQREMMLARIRL